MKKFLIAVLTAALLMNLISGGYADGTQDTERPQKHRRLDIKPGEYTEEIIWQDNKTKWVTCYTYIPDNPTENMPLVIYLHGDGVHTYEVPDSKVLQNIRDYWGDNYPFIFLMPSKCGTSWTGDGYMSFIQDVIADTADTYRCDKSNIVIMGHSSGACAASELVNSSGDFYSCLVIASGISNVKTDSFINVRVYAFVGTNGEEYSTGKHMNRQMKRINIAGGCAELVTLEDKSHSETVECAFTGETIQKALESRELDEN